ncbi:HAMP domain-containing sensor histidine kinase [Parabacteroides sp. PF5-9]|uniref:sensor histidine kinase n=1 Tax=Parabacteroides sp. PF5-9 TaxID=1742404 RepID=UPI0024762BF8|nr:HAMP domain-containing sensor histidine kinase [Parabacteroides sp. PF5-9]MDH6356624.1 signal transduction histidine kinase [Parabacteroides sp. PF5-9]
MKPVHKITLIYTAITAGIGFFVALLLYLILLVWMNRSVGELGEGTELFTICHQLRLFFAFSLLAMVVTFTVIAFFTGKGYAQRMIDRIDTAYHSEKTFISSASHELNNPLTAIQGECEITLLKERSPSEYQAALHRIASETKRIIQLMKHLLFLSQDDKEILSNTIEPIFLAEFLMQFLDRRVTFAPDTFSLVISANPQLLKIAIQNILSNAVKYSGDKQVEMRLRGGILEIKDQGIGIPPEELEHIYQPFFRASNTREYVGHGVGLSLAIRILNTYGAKVTIASEKDKGTVVSIDFLYNR